MAYSRVLQDIQTCVDLGIPSRVPIFALGEEFDVEQYDIDYRKYIESPEDMVQCWVQAVETFDYDWVLLHPDDYIELEPLGIKTVTEPRIPPSPVCELQASWETLKSLRIPDAQRDGRMPHHLAGLQEIKEAMDSSVAVGGRIAAPFSAVTLAYGPQEALMLMMTDPALFKDSADFMTDLMVYWAQQQIDAGSDFIWVGDCVASSGFLSPSHFEEFAAPWAKRVCDAIKNAGAWAIYHAGDPSLPHLKICADFGPSILNVGEAIDIVSVKAAIGDKVCLSGNINPIKLFEAQNEEAVALETIRVIEGGKPSGGYIFNTGEGVPRATSPWIIETMMKTAKAHCIYGE